MPEESDRRGPQAPNVLLSIKPEHADAIMDGEKLWEYRKVAPERGPPMRLVLYASHPVQAAVGVVWSYTIKEDEVDALIEKTVRKTPHEAESVREYFGDADRGTAIRIGSWREFDEPVSRDTLEQAGIAPSQNFRYIGKVPAHEELAEPMKVGDSGGVLA